MKALKWQWIAKGIIFGAVVVGAVTFLTMWLWNNLATALFGLPAIGFFQALGLMVLGRLLTGGFGPRSWRGRHGHMRERWKAMSEDERRQYMQHWGRHRCGPAAPGPDAPPAGDTSA